MNTEIKKDQAGVPAGGTTGQGLIKNSNTDFDYDWADLPTGPSGPGDIQTTTISVGSETLTYSWSGKLYFNFFITSSGNHFPVGGQNSAQATVTANELATLVGGTLNTEYANQMFNSGSTFLVAKWNGSTFQVVSDNSTAWYLIQGILIN